MPHFHATAVFEARGTSLDDADRTSASLFKSLRHNRIHYYEHDVTAGASPSPSSQALYFSVIAEFDVDAYNEERAGELTEEVLDSLATDDVQFIAFGLTQGEQRARPSARAPQEDEQPEPQREREVRSERGDGGEDEERKGRKRGSRGRGRKRKDDREEETVREARPEAASESITEAHEAATDESEDAIRTERIDVTPTLREAPVREPEEIVRATPISMQEEIPPSPPPRSSASMRVKLALSFRASEFGLRPNGAESSDQEEFLNRAIGEARARHPELPPEVEPTHQVVVQPWGETVVTLTWEYDVPVPSASEEA